MAKTINRAVLNVRSSSFLASGPLIRPSAFATMSSQDIELFHDLTLRDALTQFRTPKQSLRSHRHHQFIVVGSLRLGHSFPE
ncbi:hypothetical protein [Cryobacterium sp. Y82]|uniref:hypothetical protein n=1 Tax=Cryobacterium sp. Y82 TaxID=2045017 RepID=UPI0011B04368|nr:hypothetical protein [Cryobacterium sp. Y82]